MHTHVHNKCLHIQKRNAQHQIKCIVAEPLAWVPISGRDNRVADPWQHRHVLAAHCQPLSPFPDASANANEWLFFCIQAEWKACFLESGQRLMDTHSWAELPRPQPLLSMAHSSMQCYTCLPGGCIGVNGFPHERQGVCCWGTENKPVLRLVQVSVCV